MRTYGVACAKSETFDGSEKAKAYVMQHGAPVVIKADGLAAGKGVVVAATVEDALAAISDIMDSGKVGAAGKKSSSKNTSKASKFPYSPRFR